MAREFINECALYSAGKKIQGFARRRASLAQARLSPASLNSRSDSSRRRASATHPGLAARNELLEALMPTRRSGAALTLNPRR
jgi:hypothetical protein